MKKKEEENRKDKREALNGWRKVQLREVIREAQGGFACGEREANGVIQLRMNNVTTRGQFEWSSFIRVPTDSNVISEYRLQSGDVLFNNTNSTELVGKTALFENYEEPIVFSNHFTRLRTDPDCLLPSFLAFWLQAQWQNGLFANICNRWIGQSAVQRDKLLSLEIPLPPLLEQKHIAAILSEQLTAVEQARVATKAQLKAASELPAAYLREVFSSPEAQKWPRKRLGESCLLLPSKSIATNGDTNVRAITTACLTEMGFDPSGVKHARMWAKDAAECVVSSGEILIARSNTPELVGRVAMFTGSPEKAVASDLTIRIWPRDGVWSPFLTGYLASLYVNGYWKDRAGGASGSMKKITRTQIESELIPIPPLAEQQHVAAVLNERLASTNRLCQSLEKQLAAINTLPATLLREAFAGRL